MNNLSDHMYSRIPIVIHKDNIINYKNVIDHLKLNNINNYNLNINELNTNYKKHNIILPVKEISNTLIDCKKMYQTKRSKIHTSTKRCGIIMIDDLTTDISDKNLWLLVVRGKGTNIWSFGKGKMNHNENEEECAIREFYEETGLHIQSVTHLPRIVLGKNTYFIYRTSRLLYQTFYINDINEVDDVAWKNINQLRQLLINKDVKMIVNNPQRILRTL